MPNWRFEARRLMANTHRWVAGTRRELRNAEQIRGLEPRVRDNSQSVRDALGVSQVSQSAWGHTAESVLAEITEAPQLDA